ncbi:MAG: dual specificity protein phosphatase, partial [Dehalococcoidia bacterium]
GPALPPGRLRVLTKAGIGSVVDVRSEASDEESALARHNLAFLHVAVDDREAPSQDQLDAATNWTLAEIAAGRKVYIHCRSGIGRSPSIACAVLVAIGYPLADAYQIIRRQRPWAAFSESQRAALEEFERRRREQAAPTT